MPPQPLAPLGSSWEPELLKHAHSGVPEVPKEGLGPELPLTPAARSHTVTDEVIPGASVIDHGPEQEIQSELPAPRESGRLSLDSSTRRS